MVSATSAIALRTSTETTTIGSLGGPRDDPSASPSASPGPTPSPAPSPPLHTPDTPPTHAPPAPPDLSRDGRIAIGGTGLVVTRLPDGTGRLLAPDADEPDWSPRDARIVFSRIARYGTGGYAEREIAVVDVDTGAVTPLVPTQRGFSMDRPRWSADGSIVAFDVGSYANSSSG